MFPLPKLIAGKLVGTLTLTAPFQTVRDSEGSVRGSCLLVTLLALEGFSYNFRPHKNVLHL